MQKFKIEKMSCNHCVNTITEALTEFEKDAAINITKENKTVEFSGSKSSAEILSMLNAIGYTAIAIND